MRVWAYIAVLCMAGLAWAGSNSYQDFQPGRNNYIQRAASAPTPTPTPTAVPYAYGWPGCGTCDEEANVVAQWLFEETTAGTSITDVVTGIELPKTGANDPDFNVSPADSDWDPLAPGMTINGYEFFRKASATSQLDFGTSDAVLDYVWSSTDTTSNNFLLDTRDATNSRGYVVGYAGNSDTYLFYLTAEDDSTVNVQMSASADFSDGTEKKTRIVADRDGNAQIYTNGTSEGTTSISSLDGKTINANWVTVGTDKTAVGPPTNGQGGPFAGTVYELRVSVGTLTNCSPSGGDCD